ncbi:hypothetical protein Tco_1003615 [Tanacetum coccineum]|uniref:Uncharacterized protein n=1 Tax=Tanacetum coccineum TaxID=301880 RepID=A0ABQ5FBV0_9ASTR
METKTTVSLCSVSKEQEIQRLQEKTRLSKGGFMKRLTALQSYFTFLTDTLKDFGAMPIFKRTFSQEVDLLEKHLTTGLLYTMIDDMEFIEKYMLETTLHQKEIQKLLFENKLLQTQEVQSNTVQALNVDSIIMENTCPKKENSNSETAFSNSAKESSLDSKTKDVHAIKYKMSKEKEICLTYFRSLHSHLQVLSNKDLKGARIEHEFKRAFMSLFGQDAETFTSRCYSTFPWIMTDKYFVEYIGIDVKHFRYTLLQHTGNVKKSVAERTQSSGTESEVQDESIRSGNDTATNDADIRPIYDEEPMDEIQEKVFAIAALKNELRKSKENSVDSKFAKPSFLGKPILQPLRKQSVVRQPTAFKSQRPQILKSRFASQVDVNNNFSKQVTQHYLPKGRESAFAKPHHVIASSESRNSSKNMSRSKPRFSSNDMVHNHYQDEAKKKTQEKDRSSKSSVMPSTSLQSTTFKSSCVTITAMPKVNSRAKIQSHKTRNSNKPIDQKSHTQKPGRQIVIGHRFYPNKSSAVYKKTSPRSSLRWKPTGRIFKFVGHSWKVYSVLFSTNNSNGENQVVSKSSFVNVADASDKRQQQPDSNSSTSTLATTVIADGNLDLLRLKLSSEQSQHGDSDDVLNIRVILFSNHSDNGNPLSVNIKQHCGTNADVAAPFQLSRTDHYMLILKL